MKVKQIQLCTPSRVWNTSSPTIFKVILHNIGGSTKPSLFIFIGKDAQHPDTLEKLATGKKLSPASEKKMVDVYGKNYLRRLGLKDGNAIYDKVVVIAESIFKDDILQVVRHKISMHIPDLKGLSVDDLYMWAKKKVYNKNLVINHVIENIFGSRVMVPTKELEQVLSNYIGKSIKLECIKGTQALDQVTAKECLENIAIDFVVEPLGFKYINDDRVVFFPGDPRSISLDANKKIVDGADLVKDLTVTIGSCQPHEDTINITHRKFFDVGMYYILSADSDADIKSAQTYIKNSDEVIHRIKATTTSGIHKKDQDFVTLLNCFIRTMTLRQHIVLQKDELDLGSIFTHFLLDDTVPFVKYYNKNKNNVHYKIWKPSVKNNTLNDNTVKEWTGQKNKYALDTIAFKVMIFKRNGGSDTPCFLTLYLFANGSYDVRYKFGIPDQIQPLVIEQSITILNHVIQRINNTLRPNIGWIPNVDRAFWSRGGVTDLHGMHILSVMKTSRKSASTDKIIDSVSKMHPFFSVLPSKVKDEVHLLYKRVDYFTKVDNIVYFLQKYAGLDKKLVLTKMKEFFGFTDKEALEYYNQYGGSISGGFKGARRGFYRMRPVNKVIVKIKTTGFGYNLSVDGVSSLELYHNIMSVIYVLLLDASATKKKDNILAAPSKTTGDLGDYGDLDESVLKNLENDDNLQELLNGFDMNNGVDDVFDFADDDDDMLDMNFSNDGDNKDEIVQENDRNDKESENKAEEVDKGEEKNESNNNGAKRTRYKSLVLSDLKRADRALFEYTPTKNQPLYAKTCQMTPNSYRQPVVITPTEKERNDKLYPGAYKNALHYGSTPELAKKNIYVCPEVWCPKSRVGMSKEDYWKAGNKCPDPEDEPIEYFSSEYYIDKNTRDYIQSYVKLKLPSKHPKGFCLPCCYKREKNKDGYDGQTCATSKTNSEASGSKDKDDDNNSINANERYIVKSNSMPLDPGRYGLLPKCIANILGKDMRAGSRSDGTGLMTQETKCFLRQGLPTHSQGFLNCVAQLLNNNKIKSVDDILKAIASNMTMDNFIMIQNGFLLKLFIDDIDDITDLNKYSAFKQWFAKQNKYIALFNLEPVQEQVLLRSRFEKGAPLSKEIYREYMFWKAFMRFMDYVQDTQIVKTHEYLYDIFQLQLKWLNMHGYNFVICELSQDMSTMNIPCIQFKHFRTHKPVIVLLRYGTVYEPIVFVTTESSDIHVKQRHELDKGDRISRLVNYMLKKCPEARNGMLDNTLDAMYELLIKKGYTIKHQVIDYDFNIMGVVVTQNNKDIFVPLKKPVEYDMHHINKIQELTNIFVSDMFQTIKLGTDAAAAKKLCDILDIPIKAASSTFLELGDRDGIIPLKSFNDVLEREWARQYQDDTDMFVRLVERDVRRKNVEERMAIEKTYLSFWNEMMSFLGRNKEVYKMVKLLRHPSNPLPREVKRALLKEKIEPYLTQMIFVTPSKAHVGKFQNKTCSYIGKKNECRQQCKWKEVIIMDSKKKGKIDRAMHCRLHVPTKDKHLMLARLLDHLIHPNISLKKQLVENITMDDLTQDDSVIMFTDMDIANKRLDTILHGARSWLASMGYVQSEETVDGKIFAELHKEIIPKNTHDYSDMFLVNPISDIHGKVNNRLKNFFACVVDPYSSNVFYAIFASIYNKLYPKRPMTISAMREFIANDIYKEYKRRPGEVKEQLEYNSNFTIKMKDVTADNLKEWILNERSFPSQLELIRLSAILNINIIVIGRKNQKFPDPMRCVGKAENPEYYLMLKLTNNPGLKCDQYSVIIKDASVKQWLHSLEDFDSEFAKDIKGYCGRRFR